MPAWHSTMHCSLILLHLVFKDSSGVLQPGSYFPSGTIIDIMIAVLVLTKVIAELQEQDYSYVQQGENTQILNSSQLNLYLNQLKFDQSALHTVHPVSIVI